jgi:hypothetical protein
MTLTLDVLLHDRKFLIEHQGERNKKGQAPNTVGGRLELTVAEMLAVRNVFEAYDSNVTSRISYSVH